MKYLLLFIPFFIFVNAYAEPINLPLQPITGPLSTGTFDDFVGISLSRSSISLVKVNSTTVPGYDDLIELGYDQSVERSGKFVFKNGYLHRDYTKVTNESVYYLHLQNVTIVDPSFNLQKKIKLIIIEPSIKSYILPTDLKKTDNTRTVHKERYVDEKCIVATISANNWKVTLPKTIKYLRDGCPGEMENTMDIIKDNQTKTDVSTSQKYKEDKWKQEAKNKNQKSYIGTDKSTNKSVTEDKHPKYKPKIHPPFNYTSIR